MDLIDIMDIMHIMDIIDIMDHIREMLKISTSCAGISSSTLSLFIGANKLRTNMLEARPCLTRQVFVTDNAHQLVKAIIT